MKESYKQLQAQKKRNEFRLEQLGSESPPDKNRIYQIELNLRKINNKMKKLSPHLHISEHAMLRYLQRIMEIPMDQIIEAVLPEEKRKEYAKLPHGVYKVYDKKGKESHMIQVAHGTVKSVYPLSNQFK